MEEWLKVLFSGFAGNIVTFVLGLLIGGFAGRGIEIRRNNVRVDKNGKLALRNKKANIDMTDATNGGAIAVIDNEDVKIKM